MTAQPINVNVGSISGPQGVSQTQPVTTVSKSKGVSSTASYGKIVNTPPASSSVTSEAASLDISAEGVSLLKRAERVKISNADDAKSLMKEVSENIKNNPEAASTAHSNLRAMKINQLIFD